MPARDKKGEERLFLKSGSLGTPDDTNKKAAKKYPRPNEKRKGLFSLHITNVSVKDVGKYACKASVSDHQQANVDEDFIELSLYNKGEFHLLMLLL